MQISPAPTSTLPPHITPTLPEDPGTTTTTTPSGLIVVRNELTQVAKPSTLVVPTSPLVGNALVDAAKAAHAALAAANGAPAADILLGGEVALAEQVRADEIRAEAIAAFLAGDVAAAAALIARRP